MKNYYQQIILYRKYKIQIPVLILRIYYHKLVKKKTLGRIWNFKKNSEIPAKKYKMAITNKINKLSNEPKEGYSFDNFRKLFTGTKH